MKKKIELKEGEIICPKCKGKGTYCFKGVYSNKRICEKCFGSGKLDWVEIIVGKKDLSYHLFTDSMLPFLREFYAKSVVRELVSVQPIVSANPHGGLKVRYGSKRK